MCRFEKNLNTIYLISGFILLILVIINASSCTPQTSAQENNYCDYEMEFFPSENCDEID